MISGKNRQVKEDKEAESQIVLFQGTIFLDNIVARKGTFVSL